MTTVKIKKIKIERRGRAGKQCAALRTWASEGGLGEPWFPAKKIKIERRGQKSMREKCSAPAFLDESIDATYIIHKLGNGRLDHVKEQLQMCRPTKTVYLVQSPGWREKSKLPENAHINDTPRDIVDNNIQAFKHAKKCGYANILVLEDDFFFKDTMLDANVIGEINAFLKQNQDTVMCYTLGCIPFIAAPCLNFNFNFNFIFNRNFDFNHYHCAFCTTHCCIYTTAYREKLLSKGDEYIKNISDWDNETLFGIMYHEPLCYQLFPETENQAVWGKNNIFVKIAISIVKHLIKIIQLDKKPEPGFMITYLFSKLLFFNLLLFLAFCLGILLVLFKVDLTFLIPRFPPLYVVE